MLLKEYLKEYTRAELLDEARSLELKKYSGLRKEVLIDKIVNCFCGAEMLRSRLVCLTKEQLSLFRKACEMPQDISDDQLVDGIQMYRYWFGAFEEDTDRFCVYEEIAEAFSKIDDEAFRQEQHKKGWMMKCVQFFMDYYGIAPLEVIYKLYSLRIHDTIDEMITMLLSMPVDFVESVILSGESLEMEKWPKDDPLYSPRGLFVHISLLGEEEFDDLLNQQMDKSFYIPSRRQMEEICCRGYEASVPAYKELETFFMKEMDMPYGYAATWCFQVWVNSFAGKTAADVIRKMTEANIEFKSERQMEKFIKLLMRAHNSTRMKVNRGHTPTEVYRIFF